MYSNFLNHYYLSNVHHSIALDQTRQNLSRIFFGKSDREVEETVSEIAEVQNVTTLSELDRVWLRHLNSNGDLH